MDERDLEFIKQLQATFQIEADERLRAISTGLAELEKTIEASRRAEIIETVFRDVHSLKGAARSVNVKEIESICQPLESVFAALKRQELALSPALFDLIYKALDTINKLLSSLGAERAPADRVGARELIRQLDSAARGAAPVTRPQETTRAVEATNLLATLPVLLKESTPVADASRGIVATLDLTATGSSPVSAPSDIAAPSKAKGAMQGAPLLRDGVESAPLSVMMAPSTARSLAEDRPAITETVRIPTSALDPLLLQAEEMIQAKISGRQRADDLREIAHTVLVLITELARWKALSNAQRNELYEEHIAHLDAIMSQVTAVTHALEQDQRTLRRMVDEHLEAMKQILMLPIATLVEVFPRMVRDIAHDQGKQVDLIVRGAEIEIDKRILEELKDPLIHLVRNCVDHGIEKPDERVSRHKTARGTITLTFNALDSHQVEILVSDDGVGIDLEQVRVAALKSGLITAEQVPTLSPQETLPLIFQSGISTSEIITDMSGRGLGLAIVREKVEKLGGVISVETLSQGGTTFRLRLPLTLATFRGVLVRAGDQVFILPTAHVERAMRIKRDEIKTVENRETIRVDGQILALVKLGDVLGLHNKNNALSSPGSLGQVSAGDYVSVIIIVSAEKRIACLVDEVLAEEEVLVKGLGKQLSRVRNIAGATVLGNGRVVPVLNVSDFLNSAVRPGTTARALAATEKDSTPAIRILVAEDSITSRTLLKNILETSGYQVTTAVDGMEAFSRLRNGGFDLVVSDVDMPRLSGFELTTRIRSEKVLAGLPVILVTALESNTDRERGIEVGANAYIIKSSFDQSNLLEVIQRLL